MFRRALPLALLLALACHPSGPRPTPAPPFAGKPINSVPTSDVVAYANTLQFDSTAPGADTITVITPVGDTIHMQVAPEIGAATLTDSQVVAGRIIARVRSSAPFSALGAAAGITYFWVNGSGESARGVMIPADSLTRRYDRPLLVRRHKAERNTATARFITVESGGMRIFLLNARCDTWCCSFTSDFVSGALPQVDSALTELHNRLDNAP
jgi:hypothetical protein